MDLTLDQAIEAIDLVMTRDRDLLSAESVDLLLQARAQLDGLRRRTDVVSTEDAQLVVARTVGLMLRVLLESGILSTIIDMLR